MDAIDLPTETDPQSVADAQQELDDAITGDHAVMIVYGQGTAADAAVTATCEAADLKPDVRRVVHAGNVAVLSAEQKQKYHVEGKMSVAVGLDKAVAMSLEELWADVDAKIEEAFLAAEAQGAS